MNPLDQMVAGRDSKERINWTDESLKQFKEAKASLQSCVPIYIAKPSDQIWIQTDGALKPGASSISGLAATLFLLRDNEVLLGGFFNAQYKKGQQLWLPLLWTEWGNDEENCSINSRTPCINLVIFISC